MLRDASQVCLNPAGRPGSCAGPTGRGASCALGLSHPLFPSPAPIPRACTKGSRLGGGCAPSVNATRPHEGDVQSKRGGVGAGWEELEVWRSAFSPFTKPTQWLNSSESRQPPPQNCRLILSDLPGKHASWARSFVIGTLTSLI